MEYMRFLSNTPYSKLLVAAPGCSHALDCMTMKAIVSGYAVPRESGKRVFGQGKVREKSGNLPFLIWCPPCVSNCGQCMQTRWSSGAGAEMVLSCAVLYFNGIGSPASGVLPGKLGFFCHFWPKRAWYHVKLPFLETIFIHNITKTKCKGTF